MDLQGRHFEEGAGESCGRLVLFGKPAINCRRSWKKKVLEEEEEEEKEVEEMEETSPVAAPPPKKLPNLVDSDLKSSQLLFVSLNDFLLCKIE